MAKFDKDDKFGPDAENNIDKNFNLSVDFDYYTFHDFHKLVKGLHENRKTFFSIYHSNIESLQCNFERLHTQLVNLDHNFDIIALSEVWNPSSKNFKPGKIDGHKNYVGMSGKSLKSGCGLYIKNSLNTIERKDLDCAYTDDENEYQSKWIEIINVECKYHNRYNIPSSEEKTKCKV